MEIGIVILVAKQSKLQYFANESEGLYLPGTRPTFSKYAVKHKKTRVDILFPHFFRYCDILDWIGISTYKINQI